MPPGIGKPVRWSFPANDHVNGLAWAPDDAWLALCTSAGTVFVLDASTGSCLHQLEAHALSATAVDWSSRGLASAGQDGKVKFWDGAQGTLQKCVEAGSDWVEHLKWSPNGDLLASAAGRYLRIWNAEGELLDEFRNFRSTIAALCWRPDSKGIGIGCYGGAQLFRLGENEAYQNLDWKGSLLAMAWSPDSRYVAAGSQEATVNFWPLPFQEGEQLQMSGFMTKVRELSWDKGSRFLATGGGESIAVWDVSGKGPAGSRPRQLAGHTRKVTQLLFQTGGPLLASGDAGGSAAVWSLEKPTRPVWKGKVEGAVSSAAWSHQGSAIAWGSAEGQVEMWSVV